MSGEELFGVAIWLVIWMVIGRWIAKRKGWWNPNVATGLFLLGPIVIIYLLFVKKNQDVIDEEWVKEGKRKRCFYCDSVIHSEAKLCQFCGGDLEGVEQEGSELEREEPESES